MELTDQERDLLEMLRAWGTDDDRHLGIGLRNRTWSIWITNSDGDEEVTYEGHGDTLEEAWDAYLRDEAHEEEEESSEARDEEEGEHDSTTDDETHEAPERNPLRERRHAPRRPLEMPPEPIEDPAPLDPGRLSPDGRWLADGEKDEDGFGPNWEWKG
jgi:hypothetical protein